MRVSLCFLLYCLFGLGFVSLPLRAAEPVADDTDTNFAANQEALLRSLQVQQQLQETQTAIERMRRDAKEAAERNTEAFLNNARFLESRLKTIEDSLTQQRTSELNALQSSNRMTLAFAGVVALLGFCAMLVTAFFQWRTVNRLTEASPGPVRWRELSPPGNLKTLAPGESPLGAAQESSQRLIGALEQLETRILGLEERTHAKLRPAESLEPSGNGHAPPQKADGTGSQPGSASWFIAQGDSLAQANETGQALQAFEEALKLDPANSEALIRKGSALEKLGRFDEAIACYDLAIVADSSMTIAYLHKGGLLNRMERFSEALECYEKALRTQEKHLA